MMHDQTMPAATGIKDRPARIPDIAPDGIACKEERLPFTIRQVRSEDELRKVVRVRHTAYARHVPELGERLKAPEPLDYGNDVGVLLAESRLDGSPLGTVRIQVNTVRPLLVEQSVSLPARFHGQRLAEATRLAVDGGKLGRLVRIALIKGCFQYCRLHEVDSAIAAGRAPIDRQYEELMFEDLFPERGYIPLQHAGNIPHRIMAFEVPLLHARWSAACHPLLNFFCHTAHPDILVETAPRPAMP